MQFRHHLEKLSWTALDKLLFIVFGFITLLQIRALNSPEEWGLASQLVTLQTWIFIISDGSVLQSVIQYGVNEADRPKANLISLILHCIIALGLPLGVIIMQAPINMLFKEPRFAEVMWTLPIFCILTIPRSFCLKLMQRDLHMRDVFFTNLAWFGTMTVISIWMMAHGTLSGYNDMKFISLVGISVSSLVALVLSRKQLVFGWGGTVEFASIVRFALPQAIFVSLNNIIRQLDIFIVQIYFGLPASGVYNSAKMLYRVFETASDAGTSLMYPTAVKLFAQQRHDYVITIFSKAISFILLPTIVAVVVLELGFTNFIVQFLGSKFVTAAQQFNVMILGAVFLPFFILQSVELAQHNVLKLLRHVTISVATGLLVYYILGKLQLKEYFPLGIVAYSLMFAVMLVQSVRSELHFPYSDLFRSIPDALSFFRKKE
ncbi:MAG: oligosaccharide flippase family protein [Candidatus Kapaibacterium sp.]|nr:oligosaccharide flippase family protein [Bacteroidota bacterium]